jgi:hypothetical protein
MKLAFALGVLLLGVLAESPPPIPPWLAEALAEPLSRGPPAQSGGAPSAARDEPRSWGTSPPHGWDSVATAADARSLQPRAPGGGDGSGGGASPTLRPPERGGGGGSTTAAADATSRAASDERLVARLGALGLSREQALAALRDVERIGRLSGGSGGGGGGLSGLSGGGGGGGGGARPRPPADTPAFLGWEPYGLAFEKGVEASYARFRQGIVVGFGEGEKVGLVEAYAQFRAGFKEGYFATFKAAYLKGQADFEADARAAVARAYALAKAPGGASTAATSLLHAAGPPPRAAAAAAAAAAAPDADDGGAFERLQALARADARSVFDEARRLGLLEVLQGMPASERKYCAKVPLTELATWVDRLHRNATLRAARTVR